MRWKSRSTVYPTQWPAKRVRTTDSIPSVPGLADYIIVPENASNIKILIWIWFRYFCLSHNWPSNLWSHHKSRSIAIFTNGSHFIFWRIFCLNARSENFEIFSRWSNSEFRNSHFSETNELFFNLISWPRWRWTVASSLSLSSMMMSTRFISFEWRIFQYRIVIDRLIKRMHNDCTVSTAVTSRPVQTLNWC